MLVTTEVQIEEGQSVGRPQRMRQVVCLECGGRQFVLVSVPKTPTGLYLNRYSAPTVKGAVSSTVFTVHEPDCRNELAEA